MTDTPYPQPETTDIRLTDVLRALADPGRVKMVQALSDRAFHPCTVADFGLDITKSTLSHHLKTLREAGLTTVKIDGRNHSIALRFDDVESRFPGLLASLTSAEAIDDVASTD